MFITHKDLMRIFNCSAKAAQKRLTRIKKKMGLLAHQYLSIDALSRYLGLEPIETKKALNWK
jgi:hypothetical protein